MPARSDAKPPQGIFFDLDGTLIDSRADLAAAANEVRRQWGRPALPASVVAGYVGDGARMLLRRVLGHLDDPSRPPTPPDEADLDRAYVAFGDFYSRHLLDRTVLYPGVADLLASLADRTLLVVTNKPRAFTLPILDGLGVGHRFVAVVAGDDVSLRKPHADHLRHALVEAALPVSDCAMVGDSPNDIAPARELGLTSIAVTWGLVAREVLLAARPDVVADSTAALAAALQVRD